MSKNDSFEPIHLKPTDAQLKEAKAQTVRVPIAGDTAFMLKHAARAKHSKPILTEG